MTTTLTPESIAALLELEAKAFDGTWEVSPHFDKKLRQRDLIRKVPGGADVILGTISDYEDASLIAAARNLIRPLAEAYQRQPDAIKAAQVEALRGMAEWCHANRHIEMRRASTIYDRTIAEIDRRIAELRSAS